MFAILSTLITFLLQFGIMVLVAPIRSIWSGPYGILFGCLAAYMFDIPAMNSFKIWKISFSEKSVTYLICLQV